LGQTDQITALFGFETILKNLMGDPELMQKVQKLAEDPEFIAILDDPQIRKAIEDGNFLALSRHPKIWGLLNHPTVKGIAKDLQAKPAAEEPAE
jgi:hypothetical protein